ncbi:MAG TPA: serine hydrolase domain-containing protein, partial [Pyrinomonadaceae bacterium]|nr:serine hydrolase domain-containing protein [Pyrinomonadaceae bacterium]
ALGDAVREPEQIPASLNTIYDLASLTKPLVTGLLCARGVEAGELDLDSAVADYLPDFNCSDKSAITIRHLLTHTSGLPAWRPLYLLTEDKDKVIAAIAEESLSAQPGERVIYSDLGFILLGFVLQQLSGSDLSVLAAEEIFARLELTRSFFSPAQAARTGIAACENGNAYERDMCERDFPSKPYAKWREAVVWGQVHDGNAYFLGGAAGHAGLFSTAQETLTIANQFIAGQSRLLTRDTCELFRRNLTEGLNEARSFAWQLAATKDSTAGTTLPLDAFGHTGFTGTSCWIDAEAQRVFILLTNRTHARALPFANINSVRRQFHSMAVTALDEQGSSKSVPSA